MGPLRMTTTWDFGVSQELDLVERRIRDSLLSEEPLLTEIAQYVIGAGGKRIRPTVTLLAFRAVGGKAVEKTVDIAAALELIHSATLIHDDINDGGTERRGRPAAYLKYGLQEALVTGDFLFSKAFRIGGKMDDDIVDLTARVCAALAEGEILQKRHLGNVDLSWDEYLNIITRKTAMPIATGARVGALLGTGRLGEIEAAGDYGMNLGIAFQIVDDILDVVGDGITLGKRPGMDIKEGNVTLLAIHALEDGGVSDRSELIRILRKRKKDWGEVATALRLIRESGAVEKARAQARRFGDNARDALDALPKGDVTARMADLVEFVLSRQV
ncbi:MAG: polyprenyl synthetase family protein [Methanobacteriota archaeon]|nr:MAG: polyprenyl synthetase family protein [Euryarchaeota archaeon]